jgi:LmbE family N-acetylglucosaminyl deacetylase
VAASVDVHEVTSLDYLDQHPDHENARQVVAAIVWHLRRVQIDVVLTFGPDGGHGHPDHIAISQLTTAAIVAATDAAFPSDGVQAAGRPHSVSKLYYLAWPESAWRAATVDGIERRVMPWPDWAITTVIDTHKFWSTVWRAISCHESRIVAYERLKELPPVHHEALWGLAVFLPRLQHRERRPSARRTSSRRSEDNGSIRSRCYLRSVFT